MADVKKRLDDLTSSAIKDAKAGKARSGKNADLPMRLASAVVMLAVTCIALWLGGWWWVGFAVIIWAMVMWEFNRMVRGFGASMLSETLWLFFGASYVTGAVLALVQVRMSYGPLEVLIVFLAPVVAVDVGAYFVGRAIGGPKIAPSISPSKTWAGLFGGGLAAAALGVAVELADFGPAAGEGVSVWGIIMAVVAGILIAVIAQAGDFFESWMKRRAGMKDSSGLIPGHGGVFDRVDGFLAVFFVLFMVAIVPGLLG